MCRKIILLLAAIIFLIVVVFFRAEVYFARPKHISLCNETHKPIQGDDILKRFSEALQIKTITKDIRVYDRNELKNFAAFLRKNFPLIHSSSFIKLETVNNYSLLYYVQGNDSSLKPYLLCSHMDVVPVELEKWDIDPFAGEIKDGFIYGRGAVDVKDTLMAIMESLEYLLKHNFMPIRSFYIAFGHDEEGLGLDGAAEIAQAFRRKDIKEFEFLLDEGTIILHNSIAGIKENTALIGVSEKGYVTVRLKVQSSVGHSSMPTYETAVSVLAKAVAKFNSWAHPSHFGHGPEKKMIEEFALFAQYPYKIIYSNLWLFGPLLNWILSNNPQSNSMVRTTSAATVIRGGFKENVMPSESEALINHRVHPNQKVAEVIEFDRRLINDDRVEIEIKDDFIEPHPISPYGLDAFGYQTIKKSIEQVFPETITIPSIMLASTDTRWYLPFTKSVYRFSPAFLHQNEMKIFHGHNERISIDNYLKIVNFYHHLMINADKPRLDEPIFKDEL
ncbi:peroxisomal N(1)-acetyl-spermine/spermidine oxidase [Sarcoptes scabiei]|nr:peroxisomal N(1)-acetyl-spermine/spermidine oxidase [Sarcoptes scabiei]